MLDFFRKYQRYFFIVIAVVIVISFSFFGTHTTLNGPQKEPDHCVGQAVDGSKLMHRELDHMVRFLSSDRNDLSLGEKGMMPNFFNDGVIRKDLLGTGIGEQLVKAYFTDLKEELSERMAHHKGFCPYRHPSAPFISVENLWAQVLPSQKAHLETFFTEVEEMNPETFHLLVNLYLGESAFPPHILREYLLFQERHYKWIQHDPVLERANLNVFHCRSLEEWFGRRFVELSAQFVINAQAIAKERGYKVSYEEARVDLIRNGYEALQAQLRKKEISEEEIGNLWKQQLFALGISEKEAVTCWQKVMLFRRLFKDVGGAVFVDPHIYDTFYSFASKTAEIDLYHLPDSLELKDFSSLMKLDLYLDQVAQGRKNLLALPQEFDPIEKIEKKCPELVEQRFLVEVAQVNIDEVALDVSVKETWQWQLEPENFILLCQEFPELGTKKAEDAEGYFAALEGLSHADRVKVDRFSRGKIVETHPEWIQEALNQKHARVEEVSLSPYGETPFEGIESAEKLLPLFAAAVLKGGLDTQPHALAAKNQLELYTEDQEAYYRFHIVDRDLTKHVLTFHEAIQRGILDRLLEKHLETAYPTIRTKNPGVFKTADNAWKSLSEVQNEVGRELFASTLSQIEKGAVELGVSLPEDRFERLDTFYPKYRLLPYLRAAEKDIRLMGEESPFVSKESPQRGEGELSPQRPLKEQWGLIKERKTFKNHDKSTWFSSDVFSMVEKSWSEISHREEGPLFFFQLLEKSVPSGNFASEMRQGQSILSREVENHLMADVVQRIQNSNAIQFDHVHPERT